jgi:uncharacterized protein YcbK (DUF882 family)
MRRKRFILPPVTCALGLLFAISAFPARTGTATKSGKSGAVASRPAYRLRLYETHRDRTIDVVYRRGDRYVPSAIERLDYFLRDHRNSRVHEMDPHLFDLLHALALKVGRPNAVIEIICGYRSPSTNAYLRRHTGGVSKHSLHMKGEAIDIRIPGVPTRKLRNAALSLHLGGVGFYPHSQFIHVDMGRVRRWQYPEPRLARKRR